MKHAQQKNTNKIFGSCFEFYAKRPILKLLLNNFFIKKFGQIQQYFGQFAKISQKDYGFQLKFINSLKFSSTVYEVRFKINIQ
jgi:hypothetical protein